MILSLNQNSTQRQNNLKLLFHLYNLHVIFNFIIKYLYVKQFTIHVYYYFLGLYGYNA